MSSSKKGKAYCVGVGPGDPELLTVKACRIIKENDVIAVPGQQPEDSAAYRIACLAVPEIYEKEAVAVEMPMTRDRALLRERHLKAAGSISRYLDEGRNVVYLTLGDPSVYCTFGYIRRILEEEGYETELVPGVTSFCAAAARLGTELTEGKEPLHIVPALHDTKEGILSWPGNYVLMKSGRGIRGVKEMLEDTAYEVQAVENCGMKNERVYRTVEEIPDDAGYFTLIIAREKPSEDD